MAQLGFDTDFNLSANTTAHATHAAKQNLRSKAFPTVDGLYLATPILLGVAVGLGVDRFFDTKPWGLLGFLLAGTLSSFYNMFVLIRSTRNTAK